MLIKKTVLVLPFFCMSAAIAAPVSLPLAPSLRGQDAASIQREAAERQKYLEELEALKQKKEGEVIQEQTPPATDPAVKPALSFTLKEVVFSKSEQLSEAELQSIVAPYLDKAVTYQDLLKIRDAINTLYQSKGILSSQAQLRPQKIEAGRVYIDLIEGRLGKVTVQDAKYTKESLVAGIVPFQAGDVIDVAPLKRRIDGFNAAGVARVEAGLAPGANVGETDILLAVREPERYQGSVFFNNEASESVGEYQGGASLTVNSPLGLNDRLSLFASGSSGAKSASLAYAIPLGYYGTLLRASYSYGDTEVVNGPFKDFEITGKSSTALVGLNQLLGQIAEWEFNANLDWSQVKNNNDIFDVELSRTTSNIIAAGLSTSARYDSRSFSAGLLYSSGDVSGKPLPSRSVSTWQLNASWAEIFSPGHYTYVRLFGQQASDPILPSTMALSLGGVGTVRGYQVGVASGDEGYYGNFEWHHDIGAGFSGFVFYDMGTTKTKGFDNIDLSSVGAGVDWGWKSFSANLTLGHPLKDITIDQSSVRVTGRLGWSF